MVSHDLVLINVWLRVSWCPLQPHHHHDVSPTWHHLVPLMRSPHLWGPFCSSLVIWLDAFRRFLSCLWGRCRAQPCQVGTLLPALHLLSGCPPARILCLKSIQVWGQLSSTQMLFSFLFLSPANTTHLLEFAFPELIIFSSSASFFFLRKETLYLNKILWLSQKAQFPQFFTGPTTIKNRIKRDLCLMAHFAASLLPPVPLKIHFTVCAWPASP